MVADDDDNRPYAMTYHVAGGISTLLSAAVVLTALFFPSLKALSTRRPFSHLLFFISVCDLIGSFANVIGFPETGGNWCFIQAVLFSSAMPASWFFTVALVYQMKCLLVEKRLWLKISSIHLIIWGTVLIFILAPLSTNYYGRDSIIASTHCNYGGNSYTSRIWTLAGFFGLLVISFILMFHWAYKINQHIMRAPTSKRLSDIYDAIKLYPLFMIICWFPYLFFDYFASITGIFIPRPLFVGSQALSTQYGTFLGLIYFTRSPQSIFMWKQFFLSCLSCIVNKKSDDDSMFVFRSDNRTLASFDDNSKNITPTTTNINRTESYSRDIDDDEIESFLDNLLNDNNNIRSNSNQSVEFVDTYLSDDRNV